MRFTTCEACGHEYNGQGRKTCPSCQLPNGRKARNSRTITLPVIRPDSNDGMSKHGDQWCAWYWAGKDKVVRPLDAKHITAAREERDRIHVEMTLNGAITAPKPVSPKQGLAKPSKNIVPVTIETIKYKLVMHGRTIGVFDDKPAAERRRKLYLKQMELSPCPECGKPPELNQERSNITLTHADCVNATSITSNKFEVMQRKWEDHLDRNFTI